MQDAPRTTSARKAAQKFTVARGLIALLCAGLVGALGVWFDKEGFALVDTFDKHAGDIPIAYGSRTATGQRSDIAVILINEDTIAGYETRSPLDRRLIAGLVRAVDSAGPKAIGINVAFDRRTPHDADLIQALREAKAPVVVAAIDERTTGSLDVQASLLKSIGRPFGHSYFVRKKSQQLNPDSVVRSLAPESPTNPVPAFADVLAAQAGFRHKPKSGNIAWLRPADSRTAVFAELQVPGHGPATIKATLDQFMGPSMREFLKGRLVLIGANLTDSIPATTPLVQFTGDPILFGLFTPPTSVQMPATLVHAHAVAQRIDTNRDIVAMELVPAIVFAGMAALACYILAWSRHVSPQGIAYNVIGLVVVGLLSLLAYRFLLLELPSIALATAWTFGGVAGSVAHVVYRRLGVHR